MYNHNMRKIQRVIPYLFVSLVVLAIVLAFSMLYLNGIKEGFLKYTMWDITFGNSSNNVVVFSLNIYLVCAWQALFLACISLLLGKKRRFFLWLSSFLILLGLVFAIFTKQFVGLVNPSFIGKYFIYDIGYYVQVGLLSFAFLCSVFLAIFVTIRKKHR